MKNKKKSVFGVCDIWNILSNIEKLHTTDSKRNANSIHIYMM